MKEYLLLFRGGDARMTELSNEASNDHMEKWKKYMGELAAQGFISGGLPLTNEGRLMTKDGVSKNLVLSEHGEAIGGYLLIKAKDYEHAVELTRACPIFEHNGNVEIRESMHM